MDYLGEIHGINIKHKMNYGKEIQIGPYFLDGWDSVSKTAFEFDGCFWHYHDTHIKPRSSEQEKEMKKRREHTLFRHKFSRIQRN